MAQPCANARNAELLAYMEDLAESYGAKGNEFKFNNTRKACINIKKAEFAIRNKDSALRVSGVGPAFAQIIESFLLKNGMHEAPSEDDPAEPAAGKGKRARQPAAYAPKRGTAPFALLATLYAAHLRGEGHLSKQALMDQADTSGLSDVAIRNCGQTAHGGGTFGAANFYSGWSSMKTLIQRELVVKRSNPAKYSLTDTGLALAERQKLQMEGVDLGPPLGVRCSGEASGGPRREQAGEAAPPPKRRQKEKSTNGSPGGPRCVAAVSTGASCHAPGAFSQENEKETVPLSSSQRSAGAGTQPASRGWSGASGSSNNSQEPAMSQPPPDAVVLPACGGAELGGAPQYLSTAEGVFLTAADQAPHRPDSASVRLPPLPLGRRFGDCYDVVLVIDDREQFARSRAKEGGNERERIAQQLRDKGLNVEVRRLEVGDATWAARHKGSGELYVLDHIVERKSVTDLHSSIVSHRYAQQRYHLERCGIQHLYYLVEGNVAASFVGTSAKGIKTAMASMETSPLWQVLTTDSTVDTIKRYAALTRAIAARYSDLVGDGSPPQLPTLARFNEWAKASKGQTVGIQWALMLTEIASCSSETAQALAQLYPTPSALYAFLVAAGSRQKAFSVLQGVKLNVRMLGPSSANKILDAVWGSDN